VILLEQKRAEGVLATPPSALTTTRKDRAMADDIVLPQLEIWKSIPGFPRYQVSNNGRVYSEYCGRILKPGLCKGYRHIVLSTGGQRKGMFVHVLMLLAFVGPRPLGADACHNNTDKSDNRLSNLRWASRSDNLIDTIRAGKGAHAKLNEATVRKARNMHAAGLSYRDIASRFGVDESCIYQLIRGKTWRHVI
jgi:hypothetical protein